MNRFFTFLTTLPLWQRVMSGAIIWFIVGPAFVGLLFEYATYLYAITEGVRPPVEGIPYLFASVTLASFILSILVALTLIVSRWIIGLLIGFSIPSKKQKTLFSLIQRIGLKTFKKADMPEHNETVKYVEKSTDVLHEVVIELDAKFRALGIVAALKLVFFISLAFFLLIYLIFKNSDTQADPILTALFLSIYVFLLGTSYWNKLFMWIVALLVTIIFYVSCLTLLFNHNYYTNFLVVTKFGGHIEIQAHIKGRSDPTDFELILRSRDSLIGTELESGKTTEILLSNIEYIYYN